MNAKYSGRLELTWTNKDKRLLAHDDTSYEWVSPTDYRVSEVRLLRDAGAVGVTEPDDRRSGDNLLIQGDAPTLSLLWCPYPSSPTSTSGK